METVTVVMNLKCSLALNFPERTKFHHNPIFSTSFTPHECIKLKTQPRHFPIFCKTEYNPPKDNDNDDDDDDGDDDDDDDEAQSVGVKAALSMLHFYKREISPVLPKSCRYVPSCSEYSMIAYKKYGVVKGTVLTACRLCRCNPLGGSGFDPPRWFGEERASEE